MYFRVIYNTSPSFLFFTVFCVFWCFLCNYLYIICEQVISLFWIGDDPIKCYYRHLCHAKLNFEVLQCVTNSERDKSSWVFNRRTINAMYYLRWYVVYRYIIRYKSYYKCKRYFESYSSHIFCAFNSATVVANHEMSDIRLRIQRRKIFINI